MRELRRMEHFAADAIKAERDAHLRQAIKSKIPWPEIIADYGVTLAEIMAIAEGQQGGERKGSALLIETDSTPKGGRHA